MGEHEIKSGEARPAVFFDRDGTIIEFVDVLSNSSQLILLPGAAEAIADLNRRGFLVIGLTNQPNIEKGLLTQEGLEQIHSVLKEKLSRFRCHQFLHVRNRDADARASDSQRFSRRYS